MSGAGEDRPGEASAPRLRESEVCQLEMMAEENARLRQRCAELQLQVDGLKLELQEMREGGEL